MKEKLLLRKKLTSLDPSNKDFVTSLTPGDYHFLGIRIPLLKNLAKNYENKLAILADPFFYYQEEILVYIYLLSSTKLSNKDYLNYLNKWVYEAKHSWYTTDSGIMACKFIKKDLDFFFSYFLKLLKENDPFIIRIGIVALFTYYKDEKHIDQVMENLLKVTSDNYYVKMALAWSYQNIYSLYNKEIILERLKDKSLNSKQVHELTIKKLRESKKLSSSEKDYLLSLK